MRFLGLTPDAVAARSPGATVDRIQSSSGRSSLFGALVFGAVGIGVFGLWSRTGSILYRVGGEAGAYLVWALVFMAAAGLPLGRLVVGRGNRTRFLACFSLAFAAYSVVWMAAWFASKNRTGEVLGAIGGTAIFALIVCQSFGSPRAWSDAALYLFIGNAAGYFLGDFAHDRLRGELGKLTWGWLYGAGFGAGIGASLFAVQAEIRARLQATASDP